MMRAITALGILLAVMGATASASADVECMCERVLLSEAGCAVIGAAAEPRPQLPRSDMWCERADDPRCMPAEAPLSAQSTLVTVFPGAVSSDDIDKPRISQHAYPNFSQYPHDGVRRRLERPPQPARLLGH